jgi:hypothetical protein
VDICCGRENLSTAAFTPLMSSSSGPELALCSPVAGVGAEEGDSKSGARPGGAVGSEEEGGEAAEACAEDETVTSTRGSGFDVRLTGEGCIFFLRGSMRMRGRRMGGDEERC